MAYVDPLRLASRCVVACGVAALTACSSLGYDTTKPVGAGLANAIAFNGVTPPPRQTLSSGETPVDCPEIRVLQGAAAYRVYGSGERSNANVRYQYTIGETARECAVRDGQLVMKVGVEGKVLVGPVGTAGAFNVPVRIAVEREADHKPATSKLYTVAAQVPAGQTQSSFTVVSEPLVVPFIRENSDDDYSIVVGIDEKGEPVPKPQKRRRR